MTADKLCKWAMRAGLAVALLAGVVMTHRAFAAAPRVVEITAKRFGFVLDRSR